MLTKLLAIKIVANNFLGPSNNWLTCLRFKFDSSSRSAFVNEKKATSVPEINPEIQRRTTSDTIPTVVCHPNSIAIKILEGSGSN